MSEPHPPGAIAHLRSVLDGSCNVRLKVHHDREDIEVCADDPEVLDWVGYCVPRGLTEWKRKIQDEGPFTWEDEDKYIITGDGRAALWKHTITSLTDNEYTILRALRDALPHRVILSDLEEKTAINRKTVGQRLQSLTERGLTDYQPDVHRGGATITATGIWVLKTEVADSP